eukprot:scaffold3531_cov148-Chaetoceros_neogracile.AAC.1
MFSSTNIRHCVTTVVVVTTVVIHGNFFLLTPVNALASSPPASPNAAATAPDFYSDIVSPLAQISAHYASSDQQAVPPILNMAMEMENPEYESLAHHLAQLLPPQPLVLIGQEGDEQQESDTILVNPMTATFAGGCFWGIQLAYDREPGVLATCVGYTQGNPLLSPYPTYSTVCAEETGHTEACLVAYDPALVSYARLAELMFDRIPDPTMLNRVGRDRGTQYRTGMYAHSEEQLIEAKVALEKENRTWFGREVVTEVKRAEAFWPAEEVHQNYLVKGGRFGRPQSSQKGSKDEIRCYG